MSAIEGLIAAARRQHDCLRRSALTADDRGAAILEADALRWQQRADDAERELQELRNRNS